MRGERGLRGRTWIAIVAVVALAIVVAALAALALQSTRATPVPVSSTPAPTITQRPATVPTPTGSPATPSPSATVTATALADPAAERFLVVSSSGWWRATAGACAGPEPTVEPTVERSGDAGATWDDVAPRYRDIAQVASLDPLTSTGAVVVGAVGADCTVQALRTFTSGRFWEPNAATLAAASYPTARDASRIVTPAGTVVAPCATPSSFRSSGGTLALVCGGTAQVHRSGVWSAVPVPNALGVAIDGTDVLVAHRTDVCAGVAVSRVSSSGVTTPIGCAAEAPATAPLAIAPRGDAAVVWSGGIIAETR